MKKLLFVFGTRPEAIKMCPLVKKFEKEKEHFQTVVCVTAQHREMLDQVLRCFDVTPQYDLNVMKHNQDLYDVTSCVLLGMREVFAKESPDLVFVHGDTTTTFTAALAAFYQKIPVAHVEAGLRTGNIYSPWPEEANRQLTSRITTFNFAPTNLSRQNLLKSNIREKSICVTGNTVIDALLMLADKITQSGELQAGLNRQLSEFGYCPCEQRKFVLITGHRRENFGEGFLNICKAVKTLAERNPEVDFVYPVHLNPNVRKPVNDILSNTKNIYLIEPLEYEPFVFLMHKSYIILTDSGGIQEEAPSLGKPVLVMRDTTERPEAVDAGTVKLVGTDVEKIINETQNLISSEEKYAAMARAHNPYGDGKACERIINFVKREL
ncbi:MAG: UDP-N-acetylglucosamine 2-epimerase (non-hydrolyzing) [Victivallales bacterium]